MKIRSRLTGFFFLVLTVWSLFMVWGSLELHRRERAHFLAESFNQRLNFLFEVVAGEMRKAVAAGLSGDELAGAKQRALELVRAADFFNFTGGYPLIFDTAGKLLYHPEYVVGDTGLPPEDVDLERFLSYGFGDFNITLANGDERRVIGAQVPVWDWVIFYSYPAPRVSWQGVVAGLRTRMAMTALGGVLLSLILLFFIVRHSLRWVDRLAGKAERIAAGDFPPPEKVYPPDELGTLGRAFDDMSAELRKSYLRLEEAGAENRRGMDFQNAIFDSVDLLILAVDAAGQVTFCNRAMNLYAGGLTPGAELWQGAGFLAPEREWLEPQLRDRVARERVGVRLFIGGEEYWFDVLTTPLHAKTGSGAVLILKNVTAMMRQQEQLLQAQKLETVGTLTGGIAHDFNNVLAAIKGALSMIRLAPDKPEQVLEFTAMAEHTVGRAAGMISQLLALARKTPFAPTRIDWKGRILAVAEICRGTFDKKILLRLDLPAEPAWIDADPVQMEQAVLNLMVNAEQAVRAAGRAGSVTVTLRRSEDRGKWILTVADDGVGIPREVQKKIFDPFFSTRATGKGTGLGLAMVHAIVDRHAGTLEVESSPGEGAVFSIRLAAASPPEFPEKGEEECEAALKLPCRVLLVDDEPAVLRGVRGMLESLGCEVTAAGDAAGALEVFRADPGAFDLAVLDLAMPEMGGDELFTLLRQLRPGLPVILHTGCPDDARSAAVLAHPGVFLLGKPAAAGDFRRLVAKSQIFGRKSHL